MKEILYVFGFVFGFLAYATVLLWAQIPTFDFIVSLHSIVGVISMLGVCFGDVALLFFPFYYGFGWVCRRVDGD